jgi:energy-coupling factor transport system substrate-specific component
MTWQLASLALLAAALAGGFGWYERQHPPARVVALVATLAALAALGRVAFAALPNVKPTTDVVLVSGFALGGAPGFAVGALAALASNFFFGQGPWTPWEMLAWGGVGIAGAGLAHLTGRRMGRVALALACGVAGLAHGAVMDFADWVNYSDHTAAWYVARAGTSLPFNLAHATGNVLFYLAFGPALLRALQRFRTRLEVTWHPAPSGASLAAVVALAAGVVGLGAAAAEARAAAGVSYLLRAQNPDGGFGADTGRSSSELYTGWAALGLAAAGHNPLDVRRGGHSVVDYIRHSRFADAGELERTILVLGAAGASPRSFAGRDLVAGLLRHRRGDGSFDHQVNTTAFAVLALRAAGMRPSAGTLRSAAGWLAAQQNHDGGFNFADRGGPSGIDDTSAPVQGLVAAGRRGSRTVGRAVAFLAARQNGDGGFPLNPGGSSNAQSTAWAVQALVAGGRDPERVRRGGRTPLGYLRSLTAPGGSVRYSRTSGQTPVWVTGQALTGLARHPFPLGRVPRKAIGRAAARGGARAAAREGRASKPSGSAAAPADRGWVRGAIVVGVAAGWLLSP